MFGFINGFFSSYLLHITFLRAISLKRTILSIFNPLCRMAKNVCFVHIGEPFMDDQVKQLLDEFLDMVACMFIPILAPLVKTTQKFLLIALCSCHVVLFSYFVLKCPLFLIPFCFSLCGT